MNLHSIHDGSFEADQKYAEDPRVKQGVDVKGKLDEFENKQYSSDYEFQTDVSDTCESRYRAVLFVLLLTGMGFELGQIVVRALNDGHYSWCKSSFCPSNEGAKLIMAARMLEQQPATTTSARNTDCPSSPLLDPPAPVPQS